MSDNTVRDFLTAELVPLLPRSWKWSPNERNLDRLARTTVIWRQRRLLRLEQAPIGSLRVEGILTIVAATQDIAKAEDRLDDELLELCTALDGLVQLGWTDATKVVVDDTFFGYDIDLFVMTVKTPEPDPVPPPGPETPEE